MWTGMRGQTKAMALEDDSFEMDADGKPIKNEFDYDVIYWWTLVDIAIRPRDCRFNVRHIFRVRAKLELENGRGMGALFNAAVFVSRTFVYGSRCVNQALLCNH